MVRQLDTLDRYFDDYDGFLHNQGVDWVGEPGRVLSGFWVWYVEKARATDRFGLLVALLEIRNALAGQPREVPDEAGELERKLWAGVVTETGAPAWWDDDDGAAFMEAQAFDASLHPGAQS